MINLHQGNGTSMNKNIPVSQAVKYQFHDNRMVAIECIT